MNYLKSINPYTHEEVVTVRELDDETIRDRIEKSYTSFLAFSKTDFHYRSSRMHKVAKLLRKDAEKYSTIITSEMGKLKTEAVAEIEKCAWVCEYYADHAEVFLRKQIRDSDADTSYIIYQPLGPVLAVMPWNFPFWQVFRFAAPTLMAGNTALLKHASNVPGCAAAIESVFIEAGFKEGVFTNLPVSAEKVPFILENELVRAVSLTGSESAGAAVASLAGRKIKKSVLELGGNNAFVVLQDADLELAVDVALSARMINCGQSCIAAKRFIVERSVYDEFLNRLKAKVSELKAGDPLNQSTGYGPLVSEAQADEIEHQVNDAIKNGAKIETGGFKNEAFYEPTIITGVKTTMKVFREETFGPVFALIEADNMEHALELSNTSGFGLGIQIFTTSDKAAAYFINNANEGAVFVNGMVKSDPRLPFGGVKNSGFGRELSEEGIKEFVNVKTVWRKN